MGLFFFIHFKSGSHLHEVGLHPSHLLSTSSSSSSNDSLGPPNFLSQLIHRARNFSPLPLHPLLRSEPLHTPQRHHEKSQFLPIHIKDLPPFHSRKLEAEFPRREVYGAHGQCVRLVRQVHQLRTQECGIQMLECAFGDGGTLCCYRY